MDVEGVEEGGAALEMLAPVLGAGRHHLHGAQDGTDGYAQRVASLQCTAVPTECHSTSQDSVAEPALSVTLQ